MKSPINVRAMVGALSIFAMHGVAVGEPANMNVTDVIYQGKIKKTFVCCPAGIG
jgi:hypothetical protein